MSPIWASFSLCIILQVSYLSDEYLLCGWTNSISDILMIDWIFYFNHEIRRNDVHAVNCVHMMDYFLHNLAFVHPGYLEWTIQSAILTTKFFYNTSPRNDLLHYSYIYINKCKAPVQSNREGYREKKRFLSIFSGNSDNLGYFFEEYNVCTGIPDRLKTIAIVLVHTCYWTNGDKEPWAVVFKKIKRIDG